MKKTLIGIDALRGLGIITLLVLHTAFYFYDGIYDVDLSNPSLIVTLIGFLLMFAGLFAMISGLVYTLRYVTKEDVTHAVKIKHMVIAGVMILGVAYLYFLFTGPGLIDFENRRMDESVLVALINQGRLIAPSLERVLYVDSLVMIGLNILLLALVFHVAYLFKKKLTWKNMLIMATIFLALSYIRIPLYESYLNLVEDGAYFRVILLNYFVNKNNPIFPFFSFSLYGSALAMLLVSKNYATFKRVVLTSAPLLIVIGLIGYLLTPPTMLERAIDPTWYFIMVMQNGLFMLLIYLFVWLYDIKPHQSIIKYSKSLKRFGTFSLTAFFFESILSAFVFRMLSLIFDLRLNMALAILYGVLMVFIWDLILSLIETKKPKLSLEYLLSSTSRRFTYSSKLRKVMHHDTDHH